jgi:hypothetical protein
MSSFTSNTILANQILPKTPTDMVPASGNRSSLYFFVVCFFLAVLGIELPPSLPPSLLASQMLYLLNHTPSPFTFLIFELGSCVFAWAGLDCDPLSYTS